MSDQTQNPGQADQAEQEAPKPLFTVGDRQYTPEDAVKKIQNADNHISTLEQERKADKDRIAALEAELAKMQDLDTKLDSALNTLGQQEKTTETTNPVDINKLKEELLKEVADLTLNTVSSVEQTKIANQNRTANIQAAQNVYGSEYETKLRELGQKFGYNDEGIQKLAEGSPELFKQIFGLNQQPKPKVTPSSSFTGVPSKSNQDKPLKDFTKAWDSNSRVRLMEENLKIIEERLRAEGKI